jgi:fatty-acyl-CoA synthase
VPAHLADVYESVADAVGDRLALAHGDDTWTWTQFDDRAARFAAALRAAGLQPGATAGMYLYNDPAYLEAQLGMLKSRCVPVNVNYRYRDQELAYLLENSGAEVLVFHSSLADRVARVTEGGVGPRLLVQVADDDTPLIDGAVDYETLLAVHDPMPRITRDEDDLWLLYTGGTTGMPKGVMFRLGTMAVSFTAAGLMQVGIDPATPLDELGRVVASLPEHEVPVSVPCAPLMHGTGLTLGAMIPQCVGGAVVTLTARSFDADELLDTVARRRVTNLAIVGDVFSKPLLSAVDDLVAGGSPPDLSSLRRIYSSGAMWSAEVKRALLDRAPQLVLNDIMNSSEGAMATQVTTRESGADTARFVPNPTTKVFTEDGREVVPGSGEVGFLAAGGNIPVGYFKDAEKTARTFREVNGQLYSFPGDMARVEADGTIVLLGRGSQVVNTGGEKVFCEEVEEAVKRVPGVADCLVVGVDDERYGQAVTAVLSLEPGASVTPEQVIVSVKSELAGYKAPRHVVVVDDVPRAPNGKADHRTARERALEALGIGAS